MVSSETITDAYSGDGDGKDIEVEDFFWQKRIKMTW